MSRFTSFKLGAVSFVAVLSIAVVGCTADVSAPEPESESNTEALVGTSAVAHDGLVSIRTTKPITSMVTTMTVPSLPHPNTTLYVWPGLQGYHDGVLQPVLTNTSALPSPYRPTPSDWKAHPDEWWISGTFCCQKSNGNLTTFGGPGVWTKPGDKMVLTMTLNSSSKSWTQTVKNSTTSKTASFTYPISYDEYIAEFLIEHVTGAALSAPVLFSNTVITLAEANGSCTMLGKGPDDFVAEIQTSWTKTTTTCKVDTVRLSPHENWLQ